MRAYLGIDIDYVDLTLNSIPILKKVQSQHLTLFHWKNLEEEQARKISEKLETYQNKSFSVTAQSIYAFPNLIEPHLIALQFDSTTRLKELQKTVLTHIGIKQSDKFEPHITLYRIDKLDGSFKKSKELFQKLKEPIRININNINLYSSDPNKPMNDYDLIKKIYLESPPIV